jgi:vitamin B12 transporter
VKKSLWWQAVLALLMQAVVGLANEPVTQLPEVVVTATRTRARAEDATTSVTVIPGNTIEQRDLTAVSDALRDVPGVGITAFGSPGQSAFASIRGAAPDQVLVLLDGVEVNSPTVGQFDFANLTTENVARIEIVRGGGGALYGSEAIGGVVNVLTRRGEGPLHTGFSVDAGSAATHREVLGLSGAHGPFALSGTASLLATGGFRSINDDSRNFSTVWRGDADLLPGATLRGFLRYTDARAGLVDFNVADHGRLDPDAHGRSDFFLTKGEWEHALLENLNYRAAVSFVRDNERFRDDTVGDEGESEPVVIGHFPTEIITAETQWDYLWHQLALTTVGLEFKERSARIFKQQNDGPDETDTAEVERFNANRSNVAVYAQEQLRFLNDQMHGVGGMRYDHDDGFGDQLTFSGSGSYLARPTHTRLRVGYAEGFRAPTFNELFEPTLGNPTLRPETSWEINAGLTQDFVGGRLRLEPTYFYREVANLIEEVADQLPGPLAGVPEGEAARNVPKARIQGVELIARGQALRWLSVSGSYTYLNFVTPTGTLLNRPRHGGSVAISATRTDLLRAGDRASANLLVYAVGRRDSADPARDFEVGQIGSYARTDLSLQYQLARPLDALTFTATAYNLLNRDYAESIGFPAPPAHFLVGLRCRL